MRVLVVGAGGYVGSRLVPLLLRGGQEVRATFTDPARARRHAWADAVEVVHVDVLERATVRAVVSGVDAVVYLVHGLRAAGFTVTDRTAALHTADACAEAGVLGALAGVMGSLMAMEVIRGVAEFGEPLVGRLLMVDARAMRFETLRYGWDPENPLSGTGASAA